MQAPPGPVLFLVAEPLSIPVRNTPLGRCQGNKLVLGVPRQDILGMRHQDLDQAGAGQEEHGVSVVVDSRVDCHAFQRGVSQRDRPERDGPAASVVRVRVSPVPIRL